MLFLSGFVLFNVMAFWQPETAAAATPLETYGAYESTVPTPQGSNLIRADYDRQYDDYMVTSSAGFVHPGYYISREDLNTMRDMIWQGLSPWKESFDIFRNSAYASLSYISSGPFETLLSDRETYALNRDATAAFYLSLMWYITGQDAYVEKAKGILNGWAETVGTDTKKDLIRNGTALPKLVMAAEILRYTPSSGWGSAVELDNFERLIRLLIPAADKKDGFMNQGNFGNMGYMAAAIYLDDRAMYEDAIERVVRNQARVGLSGNSVNFSIDAMILDSGQQVEMGRDILHAQDSMGPTLVMARTALLQGTLVDENGVIVDAGDGGVNLFEVHNQKILKYVAYFMKYNLGEDVIWQPNINGAGDSMQYDKITTDGRGRIDNSFSPLINYYKHLMGYSYEDIRNDPYMSHADGVYQELYGDNTYGGLFKYIDTAYANLTPEGNAIDEPGYGEMLTTPWFVGIGQTGSGVPADPAPYVDSYTAFNRIGGYQYSATGGTEGGAITEPYPDEEGIVRFATSNVKNEAWLAYTIDFDQFGSTPDNPADLLQMTYGMNSAVGGKVDVKIGPQTANPSTASYNDAALAGTVHLPNTGWYDTFRTHTEKLTARPDLLTGQKTVYFRFYGSGNGYNFHANTLWFKFVSASLVAPTKAGDADIISAAGATSHGDGTVTLSDGGYIGLRNVDFDRGIRKFNLDAVTGGGGTLKLALGNPEAAPFKTYLLTSTAGIKGTLSFEHEEEEQLFGRNNGDNDVYLVYEGPGSVTLDTFVAVPAAALASFQPIPGGNYTHAVSGTVSRDEGREGSVKLGVAPGSSGSVTYSSVEFLTGSESVRVKVRSDVDATLRFEMLSGLVGEFAEFSVPKTAALGDDGWITLRFDLGDTSYNGAVGGDHFLRVTASSVNAGTVELQNILFNESVPYPELQVTFSGKHILLYPGASYENRVTARDIIGHAAAVQVVSAPAGAAYDAVTGEFQWQVPADAPEGRDYITFAATGDDGSSATVFMVQYDILGHDNYIARLIANASELIPVAQALAEDDYTTEGWTVITSALSYASSVVALPAPTLKEAEAAYYNLKDALDTVLPIPEIDLLAASAQVDLNNGNSGDVAKNILSVWFDDIPTTWTEWQGSNQWARFDFGPDKSFKLDRAKILGRPGWGSRIVGVVVQGSNNGTSWTNLTSPAANTDVWQKFFALNSDSYRYIRVYKSGSWYANLSDLKLYGTFQYDGQHETADKAALNAAINAAQTRLSRAKEGNKLGQYPGAAITAFNNAIQSAQAVSGSAGATQLQVDNGLASLNGAVASFNLQLVTLVPGATKVTLADLSIMAEYYGVREGDDNWSEIEKADQRGEGAITLSNLAAAARLIIEDWLSE